MFNYLLLIFIIIISSYTQVKAESLSSALSNAYLNNPVINSKRAELRSLDENVSAATSQFFPSIEVIGNYSENTLEYGELDEIKTNPRLAILELCINAKVNHQAITTKDIGFGIGPRLNAPGRLGDPRPVVELLLTTDPHQIREKVTMIETLNKNRRSIGEKIQKDIEEQLKANNNIADQNGIVCSGQFWHMGVIGINASKLVNKYNKPAIVIGFDTDIARGSARSIPGVNIYDIIKKCANTLDHYGGHSQAAGFSLNPNQIVAFKEAFMTHCEGINTTQPALVLDAQINLHQICLSFIDTP